MSQELVLSRSVNECFCFN